MCLGTSGGCSAQNSHEGLCLFPLNLGSSEQGLHLDDLPHRVEHLHAAVCWCRCRRLSWQRRCKQHQRCPAALAGAAVRVWAVGGRYRRRGALVGAAALAGLSIAWPAMSSSAGALVQPCRRPNAPSTLALPELIPCPANWLTHHRLTMSLLGPSLHSLNMRHRPAVQAQLGGYARGMLAALEGLHRRGVSQSVALVFESRPEVQVSCAWSMRLQTRLMHMSRTCIWSLHLPP